MHLLSEQYTVEFAVWPSNIHQDVPNVIGLPHPILIPYWEIWKV